MDPTYVQGLREAKALLDEGVLTQEEFNKEKNELVKQREERRAAAAAAASSELAGLVKLVQPGQPPPPAEVSPQSQAKQITDSDGSSEV